MNPRQTVAPLFLRRTSYAVDGFAGDEGLRDTNAFCRDLHGGGVVTGFGSHLLARIWLRRVMEHALFPIVRKKNVSTYFLKY